MSVLLWGLSAARTTLCAILIYKSHILWVIWKLPLLLQADLIINITKGDNRCSLFGIHSNILGSSLLVFLCRALIASFLSRSTLTWLCLQTINFWAALFLFLGWASNPYHTMYKTSQELRKLPAQVSWKVQFKCQICPSCLSWVSCLSWWPWWPWRAWLQW